MTMHRIGRVLAGCACVALALVAPRGFAQGQAGHGAWAQGWRAQRTLASEPATLPAGVRVVRDVAYGRDPRQRFDVYVPSGAHAAPVILMVHGGAWRLGDKAMRSVVENKVAYWVPRGFVVISVNYRMLPDAFPLAQAGDVARALATAQRRAGEWGADPSRFVLMGHSAGAHLVALLTAEPSLALAQGAQPWRGTVSLDSACLDVVQTMQARHLPLYDKAFGGDPAAWLAVSPMQQMRRGMVPVLAVCSSRRRDSCPQAHAFAAGARGLGSGASVLEEDLSHEEINETLGEASAYTASVDGFISRVVR